MIETEILAILVKTSGKPYRRATKKEEVPDLEETVRRILLEVLERS